MTDSRAGKTNMTFTLDRGVFNMIMINSHMIDVAKNMIAFLMCLFFHAVHNIT